MKPLHFVSLLLTMLIMWVGAALVISQTPTTVIRHQIAFTMTDDNGYGLYIVDDNGENLRLLLRCERLCRDPHWNSTGSAIGLIDGDSLLRYDLTHDQAERVAVDMGTYDYNAAPDWSRDLSQIVFAARVDMRNIIQRIDFTSGAVSPLGTNGNGGFWPRWNHDQSRVFYAADGAIFVMSVRSGESVQISPAGISYDSPVPSPDGRWLIMRRTANNNSSTLPGLDLLDLDSGELRPLLDGLLDSPVWSPDGQMLAALLWQDDETYVTIIPVDGGKAYPLASGALLRFAPAWSSDGSMIAYTGTDPSDPRALALFVSGVTPLDEPRQLVSNIAREGSLPNQPAWQPLSGGR